MRFVYATFATLTLLAAPLSAQTAPPVDSVIARYLRGIGGLDALRAVNTVRMTGKVTVGGGMEAVIVQEAKRPNRVRSEFTIQGMTGITAYDGQNGWRLMPFQGNKDPEALGDDELRIMVEESDFDGPLVNYQQKGNRVELLGTDQVEGTDVYKLKVTLPSGDSRTYFLDTESYVPIKMERTNIIRGAEQVTETSLGNYQRVGGLLMPYSMETRQQGATQGARATFDRIELNVPIDDGRFVRPAAPPPPPPQQKPEGGN